jgi:acyl carrier protein
MTTDKTWVINSLAELMEREPAEISDEATLESLGWDSLCFVSFIAMVHEAKNEVIEPSALAKCKTVRDTLALVGA